MFARKSLAVCTFAEIHGSDVANEVKANPTGAGGSNLASGRYRLLRNIASMLIGGLTARKYIDD